MWFAFVPVLALAGDRFQELPSSEQIRAYYDAQSQDWPVVPRHVSRAFVAAEDRFFFERFPTRSILTRQLARRYVEPSGQGLANRVMRQQAITVVLANTLSGDEILHWYLSTTYLGLGCYGVFDAAQAYFGKPLHELSLEEAAYLAALTKAPASFHPIRAPERAVQRRDYILRDMQVAGFASAQAIERAKRRPLVVAQPLVPCTGSP